uniref:Uncharacterized protein n=1 Tax=Fagus sylvatica TaxID=28930 RepID=A0A2N9G0A0_FAGSY
MSNPNGFLLPFVVFLVSTSLFSPKWIVSAAGSPAEEPNFKRPDPLRHLHYYNGGYDVKNKHYWASAAFTGVHGYAIAGVWLLCGLAFGIFVAVKNPSSSSWPFMKYLDHHHFLMFLLVLLFTFLAISAPEWFGGSDHGNRDSGGSTKGWRERVASSFVLAANQSTLRRTEKIKRTILTIGGDVRETIQKIIKAMTEMQSLLLPYDPSISMSLNMTIHRLGRESHVIRRSVDKNGHSIDQAIHTS